MIRKSVIVAGAIAALVGLSGCQTVAEIASNVAVSTSTAGPTQAKTVGEAEQAMKLIEDGLDVYVTSGAASPAVLNELQVLVPAAHNALVKVETANRAGDNVAMAAALSVFNEALAAVHNYETSKGVKS